MKLKTTFLAIFIGVQTFTMAQIIFAANTFAFGTVDSGSTNALMVTMQLAPGSAGSLNVSGGILNYTPPKIYTLCPSAGAQPAFTSNQLGGDQYGKLTDINPVIFTVYFLPITYQYYGTSSTGAKDDCETIFNTNGGGDYTANFQIQYNGFVDGKQINGDRFLAITGKSKTIGTDPEKTTHIFSAKVKDYSIYPNPTANEVNIKVAAAQTVKLVNVLGITIRLFQVSDSYKLSLADLPAGIYSLIGETFQERIYKI